MRREDLGVGKLFERIQDAVIVADAKTQRIVLWNPAATNVFGYSVSEALELRVEALVPEHLKAQHRAGIARYDKTGHGPYIDSHRTLELPALRKDGEEIRVELSLGPIEPVDDMADDHGRFVLAIVREITERKRAEEEIQSLNENLERRVAERITELEAAVAELKTKELMLRESEERYRAVIDQATEGFLLVDVDSRRLLEANAAYQDLLGYGPEEISGLTLYDIVPYSQEDMDYYIERVLERGSYVSGERRLRRKDGSLVDVEVSASVISCAKAKVMCIVVRDITEHKRAEEARLRMATIVQSSGDAIIGYTLEGIITSWNRGAQSIYGYSAEEVIGKPISILIPPDRPDEIPNILEKLRRGEPVEHFETTRVRKDGTRIYVSLTISPIRDFAGNIMGASTIARDITERRRAEEEIKTRAHQQAAVAELGLQALAETDLQVVMDEAVSIITRTLDIEYCGVLELLTSGEELLLRAGVGWKEGLVGKATVGARHDSQPGYTLSSYAPVVVEDLRVERRFHGSSLLHEHDVVSGMSVIIHGREEPFGVLSVHAKSRRTFDQDDVNFLRTVAGMLALAIERKHTEKALRQSEGLYRTVIDQAAENIFLVDVRTKHIIEANQALHSSLGYTADELGQMTLYDIVAHDRESIDRNIRRILEEKRSFIGERLYRRKDGSLVDVEIDASVIFNQGRETLCIVAHDITERKQAEESLRQSLRVLLALREASQILGSSLELDEIMHRLLEVMRSVATLRAVVISKQDEDGYLRVQNSAGVEELPSKARYAPQAEAARRAALENEEQRLFRLQRPGSESLVGFCLPLQTRDRVIGVLEAYGSESLAERETLSIINSLTHQATSAFENAILYQELAKREQKLQHLVGKLLQAQEEERRRVAYEVHDGLAQIAVSAHQRLQAFSDRHAPNTERGRKDLERISRSVRQTVSEARKIIANLRPTALDDLGLKAAILLEVERLREDGYQVDYEEELGDERLPAPLEIALFRISQEALTNIRKHAQTQQVQIELRRQGNMVYLEIRDYGRGFDQNMPLVESGPGERVGLVGMQERVGVLGGKLEIHSRPGAGTSVMVEIPLSVFEPETLASTDLA